MCENNDYYYITAITTVTTTTTATITTTTINKWAQTEYRSVTIIGSISAIGKLIRDEKTPGSCFVYRIRSDGYDVTIMILFKRKQSQMPGFTRELIDFIPDGIIFQLNLLGTHQLLFDLQNNEHFSDSPKRLNARLNYARHLSV